MANENASTETEPTGSPATDGYPSLSIVLEYQGDEVYRIRLPRNCESASFSFGRESEAYTGVHIRVPEIKEIELFPLAGG